jgi:hypothetical protein
LSSSEGRAPEIRVSHVPDDAARRLGVLRGIRPIDKVLWERAIESVTIIYSAVWTEPTDHWPVDPGEG